MKCFFWGAVQKKKKIEIPSPSSSNPSIYIIIIFLSFPFDIVFFISINAQLIGIHSDHFPQTIDTQCLSACHPIKYFVDESPNRSSKTKPKKMIPQNLTKKKTFELSFSFVFFWLYSHILAEKKKHIHKKKLNRFLSIYLFLWLMFFLILVVVVVSGFI